MDDVFKDAMRQVFNPAPPELVAGFKRKLGFIQEQYKHSKTTVQSCLEGMSDRPSLLELLTAAYVVNGGLLFKHVASEEAEEEDDEYTRLMREMEELRCEEPSPPAPAPERCEKSPGTSWTTPAPAPGRCEKSPGTSWTTPAAAQTPESGSPKKDGALGGEEPAPWSLETEDGLSP